MPTLPDYPGVSRIRNESPGLPYGSPNLPDKSEFGYFFLQKTKNQVNLKNHVNIFLRTVLILLHFISVSIF